MLSGMRVLIDAHAIGTGAGGNETYMRELLAALGDHARDIEVRALVCRGAAVETKGVVRAVHAPRAPSALRVPLVLPWIARRERCDLLHVQYNGPPWPPCPYVVSVHDIGWRRYPEFFPFAMRARLNWLTPGTLRRARRVLTLTETIRSEIHETYGTPLDRIDVVAPGVDPIFCPQTEAAAGEAIHRKYALPERFVLYVGATQPRKNLVRLAEAVARLDAHGLPHALVVTGPRRWLAEQTRSALDALRLGPRLVFTGYIDRADLPALVCAADAFAYVSIYEGFGLPVLEAMACGTPVLASTADAIREVAGAGALCCNPLDADAIERGLARLLTDDALREAQRKAGFARAAHFTRAAMAEGAMASYKRALK
jgi:glycosyltransferase involved in cell wall biosynthesis